MRHCLQVCFVLFAVLAGLPSSGRCEAPLLSAGQQAVVNEVVLSEIKSQKLVGVAVGVLQEGKVAYLRGYGFANREERIPVTEKTVFNWASNSKPVVAVAAMQLVEQGLLDLEADIHQYLPELPDKGAKITARHLLCHQSGFPHYMNGKIVSLPSIPDDPRGGLNPVFSLRRFGGSPLIFSPGARYDYSSYGYVILSAIVQRAGKAPLPEQLRDRIEQPLGLKSFQLDMPYEGQSNWTIGYNRNSAGKITVVTDYAHFWKHGAGAYKSDIVDFARWAEALLNHELVTRKSERQLWTAQKTKDGAKTSYGLGFRIEGSDESLKVSHGGSHRETKTHLVIYPSRQDGVVVLCNCGHADPRKISGAVYRALENR